MKERIKNLFEKIKKMRYFLIFGILLLSINGYAWFIYITRVDTSITAQIRSWNVMFQVHDNNIASEVTFTVGEMYPGMTDVTESASIVNTGATAGDAYFVIKRVQIFDAVYTSDNYTTAQLVNMLANNYPFSIDIYLTSNHVLPGHTEMFVFDITWPYESGHDEDDTYWGNYAYTFTNTHGLANCITIQAEIRVDQEGIQ